MQHNERSLNRAGQMQSGLVCSDGQNRSIHPRVVNGKTQFPKVNTSAKKNEAVTARKNIAIAAHRERNPGDGSRASIGQ